MKLELLKIDKEFLKENCFIVKVGSEDRPADVIDIQNIQECLKDLFKTMELDFEPAVLVTHHCMDFEKISKKEAKELVNSLLK